MKATFMKATALCMMLALSGCGHFGGRAAEASAAPQRHPHGGSGIVGSPELESFAAQWRPMHQSAAKDSGRERFRANKYGLFIHWGLYSIPGGVWNGETMEEGGTGPRIAEWIMRRKEISRADYAALAKDFNPTQFNAQEWVAIAKAAGMKYMVITSKHHDGFALFDTKASDFDVVDATPFKRDVIRELEQASLAADLSFGVYYSHSIDWRDGGDGGYSDYQPPGLPPQTTHFPNTWDPSPQSFDDYIKKKSLPQVRELLDNYELSQIWFDTPRNIPPAYSFEFYKTAYEANPAILINSRIGNGFGDIVVPGDNVIPGAIQRNVWEGIATTNNSWGFKSYDNDWKSKSEVLFWLVSNVSKGGNFLLNVGPDATGTIPKEAVAILLDVGRWLEVNGDAIYGTEAWEVAHEGPSTIEMRGTTHREESGGRLRVTPEDFWFTAKDGDVYVIALERPTSQEITVNSLKGYPVESVKLLGGKDARLQWRTTDQGVVITLPTLDDGQTGYALRVALR
jgi:alpha-L-fucosidase